jgi:hypothetical protein
VLICYENGFTTNILPVIVLVHKTELVQLVGTQAQACCVRLPFNLGPAAENMHSTGTDQVADIDKYTNTIKLASTLA